MSNIHKGKAIPLETAFLKKIFRIVNWCIIQNKDRVCFITLYIFIEHVLHILQCGAYRFSVRHFPDLSEFVLLVEGTKLQYTYGYGLDDSEKTS